MSIISENVRCVELFDQTNFVPCREVPKKEEKNEESGSGEPVVKKPKTDQQETVTVKKVKTTWTD